MMSLMNKTEINSENFFHQCSEYPVKSILAEHRTKNETQKNIFISLKKKFASKSMFNVINNINIFVLKK